MNVEKLIESDEYFKGCSSLMLLIKKDIIEFAKAYAKQMCDKQRKICSDRFCDYKKLDTHDIYIPDIISNSPYPEELNI